MSERGPGTRDLPLFQKASPTSKAAWENVADKSTKRGRVCQFIRDQGTHGATDKEIQVALEMRGSTQRPRRVELVHQGMVRDSGEVRKRSVVWIAV